MAKPHTDWTVLSHGKLQRLERDLLSVSGTMRMPPMGEVSRRMTIVRLADGRSIIYSAISAQLEDWARLPNLQRVIISHGDIIADAPGAVLERISAQLRA